MVQRLAPLAAVLALAAAVPATAAAKIPRPRQSLKAWAQRWAAAGRAGNCAFLGPVYGFAATDASSCAYYRERLAGVQVDGVQQFGTGGVIRWHSPHYNGAPNESAFFSPKSRATAWKDTSGVTGVFAYGATQSVPSRPAHVRDFDRTATSYAKALARRDCTTLYRLEVHPPQTTKAQECRGDLPRSLTDALKARRWTLYRLGGNSRWSFYGLDFGKGFLTIPLLRDPLQRDRLVVLTWYASA